MFDNLDAEKGYAAQAMIDQDATPQEIIEHLNRLDQEHDMQHPDVQQAMVGNLEGTDIAERPANGEFERFSIRH